MNNKRLPQKEVDNQLEEISNYELQDQDEHEFKNKNESDAKTKLEAQKTLDSKGKNENFRSIAILSGKGGSGKTMVASVIAKVLDSAKMPVIIVDADTATAGMTYFFGIKLAPQVVKGLSDISTKNNESQIDVLHSKGLQKLRDFENAEFFGIGDHRRLTQETPEDILPQILEKTISQLRNLKRWLIVDCRGGVDSESISVCKTVDDIFIIIELDTTSFQATQHVVDILSSNGIAHKIRGFIINKVYNDPSYVARTGTSMFRCQYLSSIPFDLETMRDFMLGEVPKANSLFGIHINEALYKAYGGNLIPAVREKTWSFKDFQEVGITNRDSRNGGHITAFLTSCLALISLIMLEPMSEPRITLLISMIIATSLFASFEKTRQFLGKKMIALFRNLKMFLSNIKGTFKS